MWLSAVAPSPIASLHKLHLKQRRLTSPTSVQLARSLTRLSSYIHRHVPICSTKSHVYNSTPLNGYTHLACASLAIWFHLIQSMEAAVWNRKASWLAVLEEEQAFISDVMMRVCGVSLSERTRWVLYAYNSTRRPNNATLAWLSHLPRATL
jgi:hypothetical protein